MNTKQKIAFISSFIPRRCGIATFTSDLIKNIKLAAPDHIEPEVIAMRSSPQQQYSKPVRFIIRQNIADDYISASEYINSSRINVISVQHEFGLFGGQGGSYLNLLLKRLNKPVITTLHTVLESPPARYFNSLTEICRSSNKLIVMNKRGIKMLRDIYKVPESKIRLIPHGIPDLPFVDSHCCKYRLGMEGRKTILTFGLLGKNKGIEIMLRAMPEIVKAEPSVLYIVLGATHPEVLRREGHTYKLKLERMIANLGLQKNVVFHNRFVSDNELYEFLGAADVYVTPYLHKEQLTSGTLAFAVGAGKAVVSTPYWAAQELLAQGRGKLVRFGDSKHMAHSIVKIFSSKSVFARMRRRAYDYGRWMTWPKIGQAYWKLFRMQSPSIRLSIRPEADSRDWKIHTYNRQQSLRSIQSA